MRTERPKQPSVLTEEERAMLESMAHRARSQPRRARVVLACGAGLDNQAVAAKLRCSPKILRHQGMLDFGADAEEPDGQVAGRHVGHVEAGFLGSRRRGGLREGQRRSGTRRFRTVPNQSGSQPAGHICFLSP